MKAREDAPSCSSNPAGRKKLCGAVNSESVPRRSEEQLFSSRIIQFEIARGQSPELFENCLAEAETNKLGLHRRENWIQGVGPSPLPQNRELLRLLLQVLEHTWQQDSDQIFESNVLLKVGRVDWLACRAVERLVANWLMKHPASFVSTKVICDAANDLFQVSQKTLGFLEVISVNRATNPWRRCPALDSKNGSVNDLLPMYACQVPRQPWIRSKVPQQTLCEPGQALPLLLRNCCQRLIHVTVAAIRGRLPILQFRISCFHFGKRVWQSSPPECCSYELNTV